MNDVENSFLRLITNQRSRKILRDVYFKSYCSIQKMAECLDLVHLITEIEKEIESKIIPREDTFDGYYGIQLQDGFQCYEKINGINKGFLEVPSLHEAAKYFMNLGTSPQFSSQEILDIKEGLLCDICFGKFHFLFSNFNDTPVNMAQRLRLPLQVLLSKMSVDEAEHIIGVVSKTSSTEGPYIVRQWDGSGYLLIFSERGMEKVLKSYKDLNELIKGYLSGFRE